MCVLIKDFGMFKMLLCLILCFVLISCKTTEENKKLDVESMKESRDGLDYRASEENLMVKLDDLLKKWHEAQRKQNFSGIQYLGVELEKIVRGNFSQIVKELDGSDSPIAIAALGFGNDVRAIPYLNQALSKGDDDMRNNAALALGHLGSNQTPMEPLLNALAKDPQNNVRAMSAFAISQIVQKDKDEGTLPHLLAALKDSDFNVRSHVVIALDKIGNIEGIKAIAATAISDTHPIVRYNSILALGHTGNKEFSPALVSKLTDPVVEIQEASRDILKKWAGQDFGQDMAAWKKWAGME